MFAIVCDSRERDYSHRCGYVTFVTIIAPRRQNVVPDTSQLKVGSPWG